MRTVYDNTALRPGLVADWGFGAWLEYEGHVLLFDTGGNGRILLDNMEELGLDPMQIEVVVLSHVHGDHTGGLAALLRTGVEPVVYVPASLPAAFKEDVRAQTELVEVTGPIEILPGIHSTGELRGGVREQGLIVETSQGIVVITGCAHPGITRMVEAAHSIVEEDIALVVGGFHLGGQSEGAVRRIVADFREMGVEKVSPTHCTGPEAIAVFAEEYGDGYIEGGVGQVYLVGSPQETP
jgi:7,8-dihydropterin-6-yl-methyl-4-(beta-D-ribofuranosyl)aminobenzene 5'-phosphate synthase